MDLRKSMAAVRCKSRFRSVAAGVRRLALALVWLVSAATLTELSLAAEPAAQTFRIGFSSAMFTDVNENDAKASIKVWGRSIAKDRGIPVDPETRIFRDTSETFRALRDQSVDAAAITVMDYAVLSQTVTFAPIFVTYTGGKSRDQYLVLVHRDGPIERLADLRGRNLTFHENFRVRLALPWLDTLLLAEAGKPAAAWLGKITLCSKLSKVVLPVFFRQSDACVVTRSGFETMVELNPQVGKQIKILATSPEVVSAVFCFRADYSPSFKEELFSGVRDLHKSVAGLQVLTVFQSDRIQDEPASCLDSALEILAKHAQLTGQTGSTNVPPGIAATATSIPVGAKP